MKYKEILALDPGTHTGYARFIDGISTDFGVLDTVEEFYAWLIKQTPDLFIVEDYLIRDKSHGGFDHQWQSVVPAQVIGAVKFYAYIRQISLVLQQPSIKAAAAPMVLGKPYKKRSGKHHLDAFLHGAYWLRRNPD